MEDGGAAADDDALLRDAKHLPLPERLAHASWKVRSDAYGDVVKEAGWAQDGSTQPLKDFGAVAHKVAADGNPNALDAGLDALAAFLAKADEEYASRAAGALANALVSKGLTARPKTVTRATDALLLLIELDAAEATVDALLKGLQGKVPKGVAACVAVLLQAVKEFGVRVIKPSPLLKACGPLLDHRDKAVRDGAKDLAVELTRWLGAAAVKRDVTDKMRDAQKKEVDDALEAVTESNPKPTRFLRKDPARLQPAQAEAPEGGEERASTSRAAPRASASAGPDVWDLMEPEDILSKLAKRDGEKAPFLQAVVSEKWKERLAAFTDLKELAGAPRLALGDYGDVSRAIKKVIMKDANVAVVAEAAAAAAALAKGLRREYRSDARMLTAPLLDKFKDKNSTVGRAVHAALAAFASHSYTLADVADDVLAALDHKVPSVPVETLAWMAVCLAGMDKAALAKMDKNVLFAVLKNTEASTPAVRDGALAVLAAAFRTGADLTYVSRAIDVMDPARKKKLLALVAEATGEVGGEAAPAARPATAPAAAPKPAALAAAAAPKAAPARTASGAGGAKAAKAAPGGASRAAAADDENYVFHDMGCNPDDVAAAVDSLGGEGVAVRLASADWKERLEAATALVAALESAPAESLSANCEAVVRQLGIAPGWEERNFQVVAKCFEALALLARRAPEFPKPAAALAVEAVVAKVADPKLKGPAADVLTAWAEALGPRLVAAQVYKRALPHKNPKVLEAALAWFTGAFYEFGGRHFDTRFSINAAKECMGNTNPGVKAAAITLLGAVHTAYGPAVKAYLTDVKPALMPALEAEFVRCPHNPAAMEGERRIKGVPATAAAASGRAAAGGAAGSAGSAAVVSDGLPRDDISSLLTPKIVKDLSAADWKIRQAALDSIETIINEAGRRVASNVGPDIMPALKGRLSDANKMLIIAALRVIASLSEALGPGAADKVCRPCFPDMLKPWGDQKKQVREAVSKALDKYVTVVPLERMLPAIVACIGDAKFPADGRRDALAWLASAAKDMAAGSDVSVPLQAAATGLADKASEVREAAAALAVGLAAAAGPEATQRALKALPKPAQALLLERLGSGQAADTAAPAAAEQAAPPSRPATAPGGTGARAGAGAAAARPASRAGGAPPPAALARTASVASTGPQLILSPPERKDERIAKLPRKALGSVGGKDFAADVREAGTEELVALATPYLRDDLRARMFCDDFKKHIEAAELLEAALGDQLEEVISVLDLLFRWAVLRLCELAPNTSSLLRVLDWLAALFEALRAAGYRLREEEAVLLLPIVLEKSGHNLPAVRERFRRLMRASCGLFPVSKVVAFLGAGLSSKNTRSRVECLEELAAIIDRHGVDVAERAGAKVLPSVVPLGMPSERDATLRKAGAEVLSAAYRAAGDGVWRYLGKVSDQQREALEAQFRKAARDLAARGERPGSAGTGKPLPDDALQLPPRAQRPQTAGAAMRSPPTRTGSGGMGTPARVVLSTSPMAETTPTDMRMPHDANAAAETLAADWAAAQAALSNPDEQAAVSAMKLICARLKDLSVGLYSEDAAAMFAADANKLVAALTLQVAKTFEAACSATTQPAPSRACKYALNALMQTFSVPRMARAVAEPTVRAAVGELLLRLLDERVPRIEEGGQLVRALNLLMLKVLENATRTSTFVALLLMLRKPPPALAAHAERRVRFSDLVVKCLIKLTRTLGASLAGLDVSEVLLTIHSFFMVLGVEEIRRRGAEDDRPLRMVKTVLYELTKVLGPGISAHLTKVPPPTFEPAPIIYAYIDLNLKSLAASGVLPADADTGIAPAAGLQSLETADDADFGGGPGSGLVGSASPASSGASPPAHDLKTQLAGIFRKIGDKATTADGIEELYEFKQAQPGVDITPHLAKTSEAFQLYIQRGLAKVEAARAAGEAPAALMRSGSFGESTSSAGASQSAAEAYQERLQRVKAAHAAGLATSAAFAAGSLPQPPPAADAAAAPAAPAVPPPPPGSRQNLDALRERMRSIAAKATAEPPAAAAAAPPVARPMTAPAAVPPPAPSAGETAPAEAPAAAPTAVSAAALRSSTVSLSELQARMARIREMSQQSQQAQPPAPAPPGDTATE